MQAFSNSIFFKFTVTANTYTYINLKNFKLKKSFFPDFKLKKKNFFPNFKLKKFFFSNFKLKE